MDEKKLNATYAVALLSGIPAVIAYLRASAWTGALFSAASILCLVAAVLGYRNRQKRSDTAVAVGVAVYGVFLGLLSVLAWMFIVSFYFE